MENVATSLARKARLQHVEDTSVKEIEVFFFSLFCCLFALEYREQLTAKMSDCFCKHCHWGNKNYLEVLLNKYFLNLLNLEEVIGNISLATATLAAATFILRR